MADPAVEITASGSCLVARVSGEMDYLTAPVFRERFVELISRERYVVLDLSNVSFCDSAGLNVLLRTRRQAEARAVVLALACVPPRVQRLLEMTGADQVLRVYGTVAQAQAACER